MIRAMTAGDYEGVYQLWLSCTGMGLNNLDDSKEGIEKFLLRNPQTCLVEEDAGHLRGVLLAGHDGRRGYIYHTAVSPPHRRQGIAERLVEEVLGRFRELGIHKAALVVFDRNEGGNAFWEAMGFAGREDLVYRNRSLSDIVRIDT